MKIIKQGYEFITPINAKSTMEKLELCGRVCYKSENKITKDSAEKLILGIIKRGHESVLEHDGFTMRFITDRGVTHEIVRHRIASYSQESTRYCNYNSDDIKFVLPVEFNKEAEEAGLFQDNWNESLIATMFLENLESKTDIQFQFINWLKAMNDAEKSYKEMIATGATPQLARSVLPNSLKTELIMTANFREWRHFFKLR